MPNYYNNLSRQIPTPGGKMALGQKVITNYGIGTIVDIAGIRNNNYASYMIPPALVATILVPAVYPNSAMIFNQEYSTLLFTNGVGGELGVGQQMNNNL